MKRAGLALAAVLAVVLAAPVYAGGRRELPADEELKREIVEKLTWDDRVDAAGLAVEVEGGEVTLSGAVSSLFVRRVAVEDAWSVDGVVALNDHLQVRPSPEISTDLALANRVRSVLSSSSEIGGQEISVTSRGGILTLEGTVDAYWKKLAAERLAAGVSGVLEVNDELSVVPAASVDDAAIADNVVRAIDRTSDVPPERVQVRVRDGVVTLSGLVDSWRAHDAAYGAAVNTPGVREVTDELVVRRPGKRAGEPPLSDAAIRADVVDQLTGDDRVDATNVEVRVEDGAVTLSGTVPTVLSRLAADDDARLMSGVVAVINELTVEPEEVGIGDRYLAARITDALGWNPEVDASGIDVDVRDSVVTLSGSVDAVWKVAKAVEVASEVAGVRLVINELTVVPTRDVLDETIARQVVRALDRTDGVDLGRVRVEVQNGTVTLSGTVESRVARDAALDAAMRTTGVRAVVNDIEIRG